MNTGTTSWFWGVVLIVLGSTVIDRAITQKNTVTYEGWQVLEVKLANTSPDGFPVVDLQELDDTYNVQVLSQNRLKGVAEVALAPAVRVDLTQYLDNLNIPYTVLIDDLSRLLKAGIPSLRGEPLDRGAVTFDHFMKYEEIIAHVEDLPVRHPDLVKVEEMGRSVENRPLYLLTITSDVHSNSSEKPVIFIEGGIHAREWISPAATLNVVNQLLRSPQLTQLVEWRVMPLVNPDGYVYTWTGDRLWRKNRAQNSQSRCPGVDLNRNFGYHWGEGGSSIRECSSVYRGNGAFSEPESRAVKKALLEGVNRTEVYLSFHSYGQYILHPWGYTSIDTRYNVDCLKRVGNEIARAIRRAEGVDYKVGSPAELLYTASGGSDDWAAGVGRVPLVFTMELRDQGNAGFVLPNELIKPSVNDAWLAVEHLGKHVIKAKGLHAGTRPPLFPIWQLNDNVEEGSALEDEAGEPASKMVHSRVPMTRE